VVVSGIQWLIIVGSSLPVVVFCAVAHTESVSRRRAAITLALEYEERERGTPS
jgi:hypothetical protein